ncbi:MFS transporter [Bdellovibrio sp. HCB288]|uniref:MFS transporter n=1 Tax=Bdellovibrio sp. HCB288 TaxID=3394355 RepID=UPI0039B4929F
MSASNDFIQQEKATFSRDQWIIIALLAFLQFTIILDFMILSPLGAILMPAMKISPSQFGMVVSGYAVSAALSGFLTAGFADKFDRKKLLMFFYCGFILGTLFCALAPNFHMLLAARIVTGLFGGVIGSIVFAIMTDLFPLQQRGRVMGILQTAFAASQVMGLPLGLWLSSKWGWHSPFLMIVFVSTLVGFVIWAKLPSITAHLALQTDKKALTHMMHTVATPKYAFAFVLTGILSMGGYMIMPFASAYTVHNLGIDIDNLPLLYMVTGCVSIFVGPLVGRISDAIGGYTTFIFGSIVTAIMTVIYTNLGSTSLGMLMVVNSLMFVGIFSRMIPSQALMSGIPAPASRGAFMSINASLQQLAGGLGSIVAGMIVSEGADGKIQHFEYVGYIMVGFTALTVYMMYFINRDVMASRTKTASPSVEPSLGH